jgi:hypothetical protein
MYSRPGWSTEHEKTARSMTSPTTSQRAQRVISVSEDSGLLQLPGSDHSVSIGMPNALATQLEVMSSWVGPMPPVVKT